VPIIGWCRSPTVTLATGFADLQAECPGVGLDLIRRILARLQKEKKIKSLGMGRGAKWEKTGN
jgi:hypothetical protein